MSSYEGLDRNRARGGGKELSIHPSIRPVEGDHSALKSLHISGCGFVTNLKSPLLFVTLSIGQYVADVSKTTISIR